MLHWNWNRMSQYVFNQTTLLYRAIKVTDHDFVTLLSTFDLAQIGLYIFEPTCSGFKLSSLQSFMQDLFSNLACLSR